MLQVEPPQIGLYTPVRPLGEGSTLFTYLYRHEQRKKYAVIKITRDPLETLAEKETFVARAKLLKKLKHRYITEILDYGMLQSGEPADDYGYLVTQYIEGDNIRARFAAGQCASPDEVRRVLLSLADTLQYAHKMFAVHGNLHPGNVLQTEKDFFLTDFSLLVPGQTLATESERLSLLYRAPEHLKGTVTQISDQYSLAVMTYEWLCGRRPYLATTIDELQFQQAHEPLPMPSTFNPDISALVEGTLLKALSVQPAERFPQTLTFADTYLRALMGLVPSIQMSSAPALAASPTSVVVKPAAVTTITAVTTTVTTGKKKKTTRASRAAASASAGPASLLPATPVVPQAQRASLTVGAEAGETAETVEVIAVRVEPKAETVQQPVVPPQPEAQALEQPAVKEVKVEVNVVKEVNRPAVEPTEQRTEAPEALVIRRIQKPLDVPVFTGPVQQPKLDFSQGPVELQRRVDADLRQGGVLSRSLSGYEERPAQIEMATLIARSLTQNTPTIVEASTGTGKALDIETAIPTPTGWKRMGDLCVNDLVFDEQGQPTRVTAAFEIMYDRPCYEVVLSDGSTLVADAEHEWAVSLLEDRPRAEGRSGSAALARRLVWEKQPLQGIKTESARSRVWSSLPESRASIFAPSLEYPTSHVLERVPAGRLSGNGACSLLQAIPRTKPMNRARQFDQVQQEYRLVTTVQMAAAQGACRKTRYAIAVAGALSLPEAVLPIEPYQLGTRLGEMSQKSSSIQQQGIERAQPLPAGYLRASESQRRALLAGLLDATGTVNPQGAIEFTTTDAQLAQSVSELLCSLGLRLSARSGVVQAQMRAGIPVWRLVFRTEEIVFRQASKVTEQRMAQRKPDAERVALRTVVAVRQVASRPVRCIQVEAASHLYLAGPSMVPTHNSLSYLIPVVRSGKVAIISTANKALQEQLFYKDIPFVQKHIRYFDAALVKGMGNYLCLDRLEQERNGIQHYVKNRDFARLLEYIGDEGDEFVGDFETLKFNLPADIRSKVNADRDQCTWSKCSYYADCYVRKMKARAGQASVIVVNHTLLLLDALMEGFLLPERDVIVVDEAHHLEEEATRAFTVTISQGQISTLLAQHLLKSHTPPALQEETKETMNITWERLSQVAEPGGGGKGRANLREPLQEGLYLATIVTKLADALRTGRPKNMPEKEDQLYDKLLTRAQNLAENIRTVFSVDQPEKRVYYVERVNSGGRRGLQQLEISAAPLEVTSWLREQLFDKSNVICTSATLATIGPDPAHPDVKGPNFAYFRRRVGLDYESYPDIQERILPLIFDYQDRALLYLPRHLPEPAYGTGLAAQEYIRAIGLEMLKLVIASRGRAFLLFSSRRMLDEVYEFFQREMPVELKFPLLRQGDQTRVELVRSFRERSGAVLFGLKSFWEGVDIAGEALSLVVIDKLPFDPPDDPVHEARVAQMKAAGENWFGVYVLPQTVLRLKQGLGRLLRTHDDRGVMAILDTRLYSKSYGKQIIQALPPARRAFTIESVERFFDVDEDEEEFPLL